MSHPRRFHKCHICGTYGHSRHAPCPVRELNAAQEANHAENLSLGLTPQLEQEIRQIRERWKVRNLALASA